MYGTLVNTPPTNAEAFRIILLTIQIENGGVRAWPTVSSRLRKSPQLGAMLTPGEVAAMPRAPNSAVPMTRAMSLGPGRAILIR